MAYIDNFSSEFWVVIVGSVIGFFTIVIQQCYKSKCDNYNMCYGLIQIHRNIDAEVELDELPPPPNV